MIFNHVLKNLLKNRAQKMLTRKFLVKIAEIDAVVWQHQVMTYYSTLKLLGLNLKVFWSLLASSEF